MFTIPENYLSCSEARAARLARAKKEILLRWRRRIRAAHQRNENRITSAARNYSAAEIRMACAALAHAIGA